MKWLLPAIVVCVAVAVSGTLILVGDVNDRVDTLQHSIDTLAEAVDSNSRSIVALRDDLRFLSQEHAQRIADLNALIADATKVEPAPGDTDPEGQALPSTARKEASGAYGFITSSDLSEAEAKLNENASILYRCENGALASVHIPADLTPVTESIAQEWLLTRLEIVIVQEELFRVAAEEGRGERFADYNSALSVGMAKKPKLEWVLRKVEGKEEWALIRLEDPAFLQLVDAHNQLKASLKSHGLPMSRWRSQFPATDQ